VRDPFQPLSRSRLADPLPDQAQAAGDVVERPRAHGLRAASAAVTIPMSTRAMVAPPLSNRSDGLGLGGGLSRRSFAAQGRDDALLRPVGVDGARRATR